MTTPFRYYLRVRYGECDAQKVVFNARYGEYVDLSITEFLRAIGYGAELASGDFDFQVVKQTTEWKASARYDDILEASVWCARTGNTSFALQVEFRLAGDSMVRCTSETIYVCVDRNLVKKALDDELRGRLERGAPGRVTDHAGYGTQR
ncbi:MAG TPA: thioesterase family protein [Nevskiaceae bacterium]|nr:thioesterase family protein [Nevskiaceae bacterium]